VVNSDRFIIRSPMDTLGGGKVIDSHAKRLRRFRPAVIKSLEVKEKGSLGEVITNLLETKQPIELSAFIAQADLPASEARSEIESLIQQTKLIGVGQGEQRLLFTAPAGKRLTEQATAIVREYHQKFPTVWVCLKRSSAAA